MKLLIKILFILVLLIGGVLFTRQALRISEYGKKVDYTTEPFQRINPSTDLKILFLGDSTVVGTGAADNTESTPGWFGRDFPSAHVINHSKNGRRLGDLLGSFHPATGEHYDLAVAQIGANDIIRFTPLDKVRARINAVVDWVKPVCDTMVIMHSGHVGLAPIFVWPFNEILGWRSRQVRAIYQQAARERGVLYVDLYAEREHDLFLKDIKRYYSADLFHPSGEGYHYWYQRIRQTLDEAGVNLQ